MRWMCAWTTVSELTPGPALQPPSRGTILWWQRYGNAQKETNSILNKNRIMSQEIQDKVVEIIVDKLNCEASEVTPEANFSSDLGADSLDTVELIMEFEKAFDIQIPDQDAQGIKTVGDAVQYIVAKKG